METGAAIQEWGKQLTLSTAVVALSILLAKAIKFAGELFRERINELKAELATAQKRAETAEERARAAEATAAERVDREKERYHALAKATEPLLGELIEWVEWLAASVGDRRGGARGGRLPPASQGGHAHPQEDAPASGRRRTGGGGQPG